MCQTSNKALINGIFQLVAIFCELLSLAPDLLITDDNLLNVR